MSEYIDAIVLEGATQEELQEASARATDDGRMCIFFPSQEIMNLWLQGKGHAESQ